MPRVAPAAEAPLKRPPVHNHAIIVARCNPPTSLVRHDRLIEFMRKLIDDIKMRVLIQPTVQYGAYGWTGLAGIVTSHIAFHFFESDQILHLDVYSCKLFELGPLLASLDSAWRLDEADVLFLQRDRGPTVSRFSYTKGILKPHSPARAIE